MDKQLSFRDVAILSFDIYGTLIDWEGGIYTNLQDSLLGPHLPKSRQEVLETYERLESEVQAEKPHLLENQVLEELFHRYAKLLLPASEKTDQFSLDTAAHAFGQSIGSWPAFADSVAAMQRLGQRMRLVALSNIDAESFERTMAGPLQGVHFDAVYTAQDIGSYKPDPRNFEYLVTHAGRTFAPTDDATTAVQKMVHVACSLFHDIAPASRVGLRSVWIDRKGFVGSRLGPIDLTTADDDEVQAVYGYAQKLDKLAELADLVG